MKSLPANLRQAREIIGVKQERIAADCGVTLTTVQNWEKGKTIKSDYIKAAVLAYGLSSADDFLEVHERSKGLMGKPLAMAMAR
jgi:transcriptional regulator with XRE-family HTH domain